MPLPARLRLRNALIIGGILMLVTFGYRTTMADALAHKVTVEPCSLVRPETIARLVPNASPAETDTTMHGRGVWCTVRGSIKSGASSAEVVLFFGFANYGRLEGKSPVKNAHDDVTRAQYLDSGGRPTPGHIGDESYEYGWTYQRVKQFAEVRVRVGATTIQARLDAQFATQEALFEATRLVAQEVAARCCTTA